MKPEDIIKAVGIIGELAKGISEITVALSGTLTHEQLQEFIDRQNELQKKLEEELLNED